MSKASALIVISALVAGCGTATETSDGAATTIAAAPTSSLASTTTSPGEERLATTTTATADATVDPDAAVVAFIAALEESLAGTRYEGEALDSPEVFVATGQLFCEQLDAGAERDEILVSYIEALTGAPPEAASDDDLVLAGSLLGVSVGALCPEHEAGVSD